MGYIYKITNDINDKVYIGKTLNTVEERWKEHIQEAGRPRSEKRPLYNAINKYGKEHFHIEMIEEVDYHNIDTAEQYWIMKYDSYSNGYNTTLGGDGTRLADYEYIYELWCQGMVGTEIQNVTHYDSDTITKALRQYNVTDEERLKRVHDKASCQVAQLDENDNVIAIYDSLEKAATALGKPGRGSNIGRVCSGQRKIAYGYKWKRVADLNNAWLGE